MVAPKLARALVAVAATGALTAALTFGAKPAPAAPAAVPDDPTYSNVAYQPDGNPAHRLDLYTPTTRGPHPLVIYIHGGAWLFGDKSMKTGVSSGYDSLRRLLLAKGYAVATVNYRFSKEARFPAQLDDVRAAVRYLRENASTYALDPDRFVAAGDSAGGQLALLLGLAPPPPAPKEPNELYASSRVRAVVSYYGVTDIPGIYADRQDAPGCVAPAPAPKAASAEGRLVGGDPLQGSAGIRAKAASPVQFSGGPSVPVLMFHGTEDCLVPLAQATRLQLRLSSHGGVAELKTIPAGHAWPIFFRDPTLQDDLIAFLERYNG